MMRTPVIRWPLMLVLVVGGMAGLSAAQGDPTQDQHALLRTRNIFDPTRQSGRSTEGRREREAPVRVEALRLIGTMLHEGRAFGFFDGSSSSFRQVLSPGEAIAGMKLASVTTAGVELAEEDGTVHWIPVGSGLRREGEGVWSLAEGSVRSREERDATAADGSEAAASEPGDSATAGAGSESDDIVKRMMERRRREESP